MDWIDEGIAIGGWEDTLDHGSLQAVGVQAVLRMYGPEEEPDGFPFAADYLQLYAIDGRRLPREVLRQGVEFIRRQRELERKILVCCSAGMSRSPTFLAAYLHEQGMDLLEAYLTILRRRPKIIPHPVLIGCLVEYYGISTPATEILVELVRARNRRWIG